MDKETEKQALEACERWCNSPVEDDTDDMSTPAIVRRAYLAGYEEARGRPVKPDDLYNSFGYALAMRVMQSDLYAHLDERERGECDAFVRGRASGQQGADAVVADAHAHRLEKIRAQEKFAPSPQITTIGNDVAPLPDLRLIMDTVRYSGSGMTNSEILDYLGVTCRKSAAQPSDSVQGWQPIETVELGKMVMLIGGGWRHEFAGQVCDRNGLCVLDSPTPEHKVSDHYATYWKPLSEPPGGT